MPARTGARAISFQLSRSGTSVAANYRAARRARSRAEFLAKLQITLEEADETHFWLGLALEGGYLPANRLKNLIQEADELTAMIVSSLKTAKRSQHLRPL
jgi:four helix bundle protein